MKASYKWRFVYFFKQGVSLVAVLQDQLKNACYPLASVMSMRHGFRVTRKIQVQKMSELEQTLQIFSYAQDESPVPIKRNTFESVLMRWMNLEPIIQSKVSQKEKDKYHILMYIYMESRKMVLINLSARQQ